MILASLALSFIVGGIYCTASGIHDIATGVAVNAAFGEKKETKKEGKHGNQ